MTANELFDFIAAHHLESMFAGRIGKPVNITRKMIKDCAARLLETPVRCDEYVHRHHRTTEPNTVLEPEPESEPVSELSTPETDMNTTNQNETTNSTTDNTEAKKSNTNQNRITHKKFFQVCGALKEESKSFLETLPTEKEACKKLSTMCGFDVPISTLREAKEVTGIQWVSRKKLSDYRKTEINLFKHIKALAVVVRAMGVEVGVSQAIMDELEEIICDIE